MSNETISLHDGIKRFEQMQRQQLLVSVIFCILLSPLNRFLSLESQLVKLKYHDVSPGYAGISAQFFNGTLNRKRNPAMSLQG